MSASSVEWRAFYNQELCGIRTLALKPSASQIADEFNWINLTQESPQE